jgi:hypothetical protein
MLCRNIADRQALDWPARTEMYEVLAWRVPDAKSDYEYLGTMAAPVFINQHRHLKTLREDLSYV